jgi:rSAM/selenodomain-associated transferase 1
MAKEPEVGKTKTRLSPPLSKQEAAALYEGLLLDSIDMLTGLEWADLAIAISPPEGWEYFKRITPPGTRLLPIEGRDIGECLRLALGTLLNIGYSKVMAINADGPSLPGEYLQQALVLLDKYDIVFGESHDGGYYLVGMKQFHNNLFQGIIWSTSQVLKQTLEIANKAGLSVGLAPAWYDIDTIQDLEHLKSELSTLPPDQLIHTRRILATFDLSEIPDA